jgi:AcrR family transcriptional regulator
MIRNTKTHDERKKEIILAALDLFYEKGFYNTAVSDIVKQIGVAQGTFYYYFKTKEEILDSIVDQYVESLAEDACKIISEAGLNAIEKFRMIYSKEMTIPEEMNDFISKLNLIKDLNFHQKLMIRLVEKYIPTVSKIVEQGIKDGIFHTKHPLESTEILILGFHFLLDPGIVNWDEKSYKRRINASGEIIENTLIAEKGSFNFFPELLDKYVRSFHEFKIRTDKN